MSEPDEIRQTFADGMAQAITQGIRCSCGSYFVGVYYTGSEEYDRWHEDHAACDMTLPKHPPTMLGTVRWTHEPPSD